MIQALRYSLFLLIVVTGFAASWIYHDEIVQFASSVKSRLVVEEIVVAEDSRVQNCDVREDQVVCSTTQSLLNVGAMGQEGLKNIFVDENNFELVGNVEKGSTVRRLSRGVGRLDFIQEDGSAFTCTGFLISEELLLTAGHCVKKDDGTWKAIRSARLRLGYYEGNGFKEGSDGPSVVKLDLHYSRPSSGEPDVHPETAAEYIGPRDLDYALLGLRPGEFADNVTNAEDPRHRIFGPVDIARVSLEPDHELVVLHHPRGDRMMLTRRYCRSAEENDSEKNPYPSIFDHRCDTLKGSSGAPVFSRGHEAVTAIHLCCKEARGAEAGAAKTNLNYALHLEAVAKNNETVRKLMIEEPITARESREMLSLRSKAQELLEVDPVAAFRLAVGAFRLQRSMENRQTLNSAISAIDLAYQEHLNELVLIHGVDGKILLERLVEKGGYYYGSGKYIVKDLEEPGHSTIESEGNRVWLVPVGSDFRFLVEDLGGEDPSHQTRTYTLYDRKGIQIGDAVPTTYGALLKFTKSDEVVIGLYQYDKLLIWDLATDGREEIQFEFPDDLSSDPELLAANQFGYAALFYEGGLVLGTRTGALLANTAIELGIDPRYIRGSFSNDGTFFALRHHGKLGVWAPNNLQFDWLNSNWGGGAYAWSPEGHKLAFSNLMTNPRRVSVELIDAEQPTKSRRVVYKSEKPVRSMTFVPGGKYLAIRDSDGLISVIDLRTSSVFAAGKHSSASTMYATESAIVTSSFDPYTRVWNLRQPPARHWVFQSSTDRKYIGMGAADQSWKFLAVPYQTETAGNGGIEVRGVESGHVRDLDGPDLRRLYSLSFSPDTNWLAILTTNELWIYNTTDWNVYKFSPTKAGHYFLQMRFSDDALRVQTYVVPMGSQDHLDYVFDFAKGRPALVDEVPTLGKAFFKMGENIPQEAVAGWEERGVYKSNGSDVLRKVVGVDWVTFVGCRSSFLRNCDIGFVPTDADKLIGLYDELVWKPTDVEMQHLLKDGNAP